jgi:hypothetical protein
MRRPISWTAALAAVLIVAGLATLHFYASAQGQQRQAPTSEGDAHQAAFLTCAKACNDCQRICDACNAHCSHLVASGQKEHMKTARTCQDCATFCSAAAQIVARHGPFSDLICSSCAEACGRCGKACDEMGHDKMMKDCAEECKRCEKACREMVNHTGKGGASTK